MPETLTVIDATADDLITLDWGDVAPGSSADLKFRIRNQSAEYYAGGVTAAVDDTVLYLSTDGITFAAEQDVGDIAPQGASPILTLRRVIPRAAPDGAGSGTLALTASEWRPALTA